VPSSYKEFVEAVEDLELDRPKFNRPTILKPPREYPPVPTCDDDVPIANYPDYDPLKSRVVCLSRKQYRTKAEADKRFKELRKKYHGWRWIDRIFWTASYWCWRIQE